MTNGSTWVPHVLHQTWKTKEVPQGLQKACKTWRNLQPTWRYRLWTDEANEALVSSKYPWLLSVFGELSSIQRADIMRYLYMHSFGGVYADLDVTLVQPLRPLLARHRRLNASILIGQEPLAHALLLERRPRQVSNAVLISIPGHPFWLDAVRHAVHGVDSTTMYADPVGITGSRMLERAVTRWHRRRREAEQKYHLPRREDLVVVDPDVFFHPWDPIHNETLRRRCSRLSAAASADAAAILAVCAQLRRDRFRPTSVPPGRFTHHTWAHSWMPS